MRLQEKARIVMMTLALVIAEAVVAEQYDFEAIAKAIEGCETLENFRGGVARVTMNGERFYIDCISMILFNSSHFFHLSSAACILEVKSGKFSTSISIIRSNWQTHFFISETISFTLG